MGKKKADDDDTDWSFVDSHSQKYANRNVMQVSGDPTILYHQAKEVFPQFRAEMQAMLKTVPGGGNTIELKIPEHLKHLFRIVEKMEFSTKYPGRADGVL